MIYAKTILYCSVCEPDTVKDECKKCIWSKHHKILDFIPVGNDIKALLLVDGKIMPHELKHLYDVKEEPDLCSKLTPFKNPVPSAEDEDWISVWDDENRPKEGKHYWVILESEAIFEAVYKDGHFVDIYSKDYSEEIFDDVCGYKIKKED